MTAEETPAPKKRRRTNSKIGSSPNRDEYIRLIEAGWSSFSLERYAAYRFGEDIKAGTFRSYKSRLKIEVTPSALMAKNKTAGQPVIDVMKVRQELASLQMDRIGIDSQHERDMSKLFNTTGREIDLLSRLLDRIKEDAQDYGTLPTTTRIQEAQDAAKPQPGAAPASRSLGDVLGWQDPAAVAEAAKMLHNVVPIRGEEAQ